jgi:hypothetical protein
LQQRTIIAATMEKNKMAGGNQCAPLAFRCHRKQGLQKRSVLRAQKREGCMFYRAVGTYLKEFRTQSRDQYRFPVKIIRSKKSASAIITTVGTGPMGTEIEFEFLLPDAPEVRYGDEIAIEPGYFIGVVTTLNPIVREAAKADVAAQIGRRS